MSKCISCKWFFKPYKSFSTGQCRRYPPQVIPSMTIEQANKNYPAFPIVDEIWFCGEYVNKNK